MEKNLICNGIDATGYPKKKCIHRRGCRLWKDNYLGESGATHVSSTSCIDNDYSHLDRFRYSDGTPIKQKETE